MCRAGVHKAQYECLYRSPHRSYRAGMWIPSHSTARTVPESLGYDPLVCRGPGNLDLLPRSTCHLGTGNYNTIDTSVCKVVNGE